MYTAVQACRIKYFVAETVFPNTGKRNRDWPIRRGVKMCKTRRSHPACIYLLHEEYDKLGHVLSIAFVLESFTFCY